ncbi:DUF3016 domain-containing protein [Xanthomonas sp. XNM01]|uniref:DUF3016 domain-containing protein n=1 Tax=Xanthomonas sp. XNM01 TaxID=2769289 RepID=UPI0017806D7E|nr:DUF3016 domain-containing protein [Xanthomonas sp. XNM01]MBD9371009.1 DUF3016 domain-containing protein [Xanthomonas sp. XNM01]
MKLQALTLALLLPLVALPAQAARQVTDPDLPRALPADGKAVSVEWSDPARFSDILYSGNRWEAERGDWVTQIASYLQDRADKRLPEGQRMDVTITDIQRAGRYEPWLGVRYDSVRIMRDMYPPQISLNFRITDTDGQVVAEGERKLRDSSYLQNVRSTDTDALRYEKRMLDDWLRREIPVDRSVTSR